MSTTARVLRRPDCDVCKQNNLTTPAEYDGKTVHGPWANMCGPHFELIGVGLGTGRGQRLLVEGEESD